MGFQPQGRKKAEESSIKNAQNPRNYGFSLFSADCDLRDCDLLILQEKC